MRFITTTMLAMALIGCSEDTEDGESKATGSAMYRDAATDSGGNSTDAAAPSDDFHLELRAEGTGTFTISDPECKADELAGGFEALYEGTAQVDDDGVYVASLTYADAQTPSGCAIPDLDIGLVTDIVFRGELAATSQNCASYCEAKARAYAESECSGDADQVTCRADAQTDYQGDCTTSCTSSTHTIVAQTTLTGTALSSLGLSNLTGASLGNVSADLTFDHVEDADGDEVEEK